MAKKCISLVMRLENQALSQYDDYNFNSFCKIGDTYLGANEDGIYSLGGNDDNGTDIDAIFQLILSDWGLPNVKRIRRIFIGYETNGDLTIKVSNDNDNWRSYTLSYALYDRQQGNYVAVGRDGIGRYWTVRIENVDGCEFAIDSIDVLPVVLNVRRSMLL